MKIKGIWYQQKQISFSWELGFFLCYASEKGDYFQGWLAIYYCRKGMLPAIPVNEEFFSSEKIFQKNWNQSFQFSTDPTTRPCSLPLPQKGTWGEFRMEKNRKLSVLGCWPWIVKIRVSWVISVSPGSCIFSYIEKSFLINVTRLLLVISNTVSMFDYMSPHHHSNKTLLYILAPPVTLQSSTSELSGRLSPRLQSSVRYLNET